VGELQRRGHGAADPDDFRGRERPLLFQPLPDVPAVHEGHGEPEELRRAAADRHGRDAGVEHAQNVGVLEPRGDPDLPAEALGAKGGAEVGIEQLEGDRVPRLIVREIYRGHATASQLPLDGVAAGEGGLELLAKIGLHAIRSASSARPSSRSKAFRS
jgi:hypothetical protein